jgi:integrase/recombinase XerD
VGAARLARAHSHVPRTRGTGLHPTAGRRGCRRAPRERSLATTGGIIAANPAIYARLPKIHTDESRTQGLERLEQIRFLQVAQTLTVHHGALASLPGINALRASEAAAVRTEDYQQTLRGHQVLYLVGKGCKPATMPLTVPVIRVLEACEDNGPGDLLCCDRCRGSPLIAATSTGWCSGSRRRLASHATSVRTRRGMQRSRTPSTPEYRSAMLRSSLGTTTQAPPSATTARGILDRHGVHVPTAYVAGV